MSINLRIFNTLFLAVFVTAMGAGLVAPLLPVYAHELGAGAFQIGLIFGAFSLTRSIFVPYFGKLSDRKGHRQLPLHPRLPVFTESPPECHQAAGMATTG